MYTCMYVHHNNYVNIVQIPYMYRVSHVGGGPQPATLYMYVQLTYMYMYMYMYIYIDYLIHTIIINNDHFAVC